MGILNSVVKNRFGDFYKLQSPLDTNTQLSLKTQSFWNESSTQQFINNLTVPNEYWREIVYQYSPEENPVSLTTQEIEKKVSNLMMQGKIRMYPVEIPDAAENPPENRVIKNSDDIIYRFMPTSALLMLKNATVKQFQSSSEAKAFISELNPSNEKLTTIASELKIEIPNTASINKEETITAVSAAMVAGSIVIIEDKISSSPAMNSKFIDAENTIGNKKPDLGPHETEEIPLHWFAIQLVNEIGETYRSETFDINLSDNNKARINEGSTIYRKEKLPSGKCRITFVDFYKQIEQWLEERSQ